MKRRLLALVPSLLLTLASLTAQTNNPGWTVNPSAYDYDMEVIAQVKINGITIPTGGILGAFIGSSCVGVANSTLTGPSGPVYTLRVYNNSTTGTVSFRFYHTHNDKVYQIPEVVTFLVDGQAGSALNPVGMNCVPSNDATLTNLLVSGTGISGFSPSVLNYSVTLPFGTSTIPNVVGIPHDAFATCQVVQATSIPGSAVATVTAENGTTQLVYRVDFVLGQSSNAALSDLKIDGVTVTGFSPYILTYNKMLASGTTLVPTVTATPADGNARVTILPAGSIPGTTYVEVTAADGITHITYSVIFSTEPSHDASLAEIRINGVALDNFSPAVLGYNRVLPFGTTTVPLVTATATFPSASLSIQQAPGLPGTAYIDVTAQDGTSRRRYNISFVVSRNAALSDLRINNIPAPGFSPDRFQYFHAVPVNQQTIPVVTATAADPQAVVTIVPATVLPGSTLVIVLSADTLASKTYRVDFVLGPNSDATLAGIQIDGTALASFSSTHYQYYQGVPTGQTRIPVVTATSTDPEATVTVTQASAIPGAAVIRVTAKDGITQLSYAVTFEYRSGDANLIAVSINGVPVLGFNPAYTYYNISLNLDNMTEPVMTFILSNVRAAMTTEKTIERTGDFWLRKVTYRVRITAEDATRKNYTFEISYPLTGVEVLAIEEAVTAYPNPCGDYVWVRLPAGNRSPVRLTLTGTDGRAVETRTCQPDDSGLIRLSLEKITPGIYFLTIPGNTYQGKIKLLKY